MPVQRTLRGLGAPQIVSTRRLASPKKAPVKTLGRPYRIDRSALILQGTLRF